MEDEYGILIRKINRKISFLKGLKSICNTGIGAGIAVSVYSMADLEVPYNFIGIGVGAAAIVSSCVASSFVTDAIRDKVYERMDIEDSFMRFGL